MTKTVIDNTKSVIWIALIVGGFVFSFSAFKVESQNTKEKVEKNTEDIKSLKESIQDLLLIVQLEKQDKTYVKESVKRIEETVSEMKQDVKEILLAK